MSKIWQRYGTFSLALLASIVLIAFLSSCGSETPSKPEPAPEKVTSTQAPAPTEPSPAEQAAAETKPPPEPTPEKVEATQAPAPTEPSPAEQTTTETKPPPEPAPEKMEVTQAPAPTEPSPAEQTTTETKTPPEPAPEKVETTQAPAPTEPSPVEQAAAETKPPASSPQAEATPPSTEPAGGTGTQGGGPIVFADTKSMPPVTFKHELHASKGFKCADCHAGTFAMQKGATSKADLTMAAMREGKTCGTCHNGNTAFTVAGNCMRCHAR